MCPYCGGDNIEDITHTVKHKFCHIHAKFGPNKIVRLIEKNQRLFRCLGKAWRPHKQYLGNKKYKQTKEFIDCETEFLITFNGGEV